MSRPKFVQARRTTLSIGISAAEASEIKLKSLKDIYGEDLAMADFGDEMYLTIAPGTEFEEIVKATDFTVNSDSTVTIDTGIVRGLSPVSAYGTTTLASPHAAGTVVVVSNNPQFYEAILAYLEGIVNAGAADGSITTAGIFEEATTAEIDADTGLGATTRRLVVNPERLSTSIYRTRLPSADGKQMLDTVTGMVFDYAGNTTPTGFLLCDGTAYNNDDYADLIAVLLGYYGVSGSNEFTADHTTETFTDVSHGMSNGDIVLVSSSAADLPAGLSANTIYYIVGATTNTFQLALTAGGAAVAISDNGTGTHKYHTQFKVPDLRGSVAIGKGQKTVTFDFLDADVTVGSDLITLSGSNLDFLQTGQAVVLSTSGVLPTGLSATTYYIVRISSTTFKLATSRANADDATVVDITAAAGGGTHTFTLTVNASAYTIGAGGGEELHTLQTEELASHTHSYPKSNGAGSSSVVASNLSDGSTNNSTAAGSDTPHNNMPPYVTLTKIIKT